MPDGPKKRPDPFVFFSIVYAPRAAGSCSDASHSISYLLRSVGQEDCRFDFYMLCGSDVMRFGMGWVKWASAIVLVGVMASNTMAAVLLSTLGTVDGGYGGSPDAADEFVTGNVDLSVSSIDLSWVFGLGSTTNRIGIFTDAAGLPSGTQVGTWFTSGVATMDNSLINYVGSATLSANTTYHLVVDIDDFSNPAYNSGGFFADPSTLGASNGPGSSYGEIGGAWDEDPANLVWALNGTVAVVPEPTSMAIFGLGAVGLAYRARRKTNKV
jgi:hypothetical protein